MTVPKDHFFTSCSDILRITVVTIKDKYIEITQSVVHIVEYMGYTKFRKNVIKLDHSQYNFSQYAVHGVI